MGRKSQVDKFKARLSKKKIDEVAVNTREYQKRQEDVQKYGAEGVDELMKQGSIKEAAVVFSHEGMKAFANMFSNSVESSVVNVLSGQMDVITKSIEAKVESIIEAKMLEMLEGMTEGMKKLSQPQTEVEKAIKFADTYGGSADTLKDEVTEEQAESLTNMFKNMFPNMEALGEPPVDIVSKPQAKFEQKVRDFRAEKLVESKKEDTKRKDHISKLSADGLDLEPVSTPPGHNFGVSKEDMSILEPYFMSVLKKYEGTDVRSADLVRLLREEYSINMINPTAVFTRLVKKDPNLEKVGFGLYKYEEKTFRPTI